MGELDYHSLIFLGLQVGARQTWSHIQWLIISPFFGAPIHHFAIPVFAVRCVAVTDVTGVGDDVEMVPTKLVVFTCLSYSHYNNIPTSRVVSWKPHLVYHLL